MIDKRLLTHEANHFKVGDIVKSINGKYYGIVVEVDYDIDNNVVNWFRETNDNGLLLNRNFYAHHLIKVSK